MKNILLGAISASVITFALAAPAQAASVSTTSWTPSSLMNALKARAALAYAPASLKDNFTPGHAAFGADSSSSYSTYNDWLDQYYASQAFKDYYASASSALAPGAVSHGSASQQAGSSFGSGSSHGSRSVYRSGSSNGYGTRVSGYSHSHALSGGHSSGSGHSGSGSAYGHSHGGAIAGHSHSRRSNGYRTGGGSQYHSHATSGASGRSVFQTPNIVRGINRGSSRSNGGVFLGGSGGAGYASYAAQYQQYLKQLSAYNAYLASYRNGSIAGGSTSGSVGSVYVDGGYTGGGYTGGGYTGPYIGGGSIAGGTTGGGYTGPYFGGGSIAGGTTGGGIIGGGTIGVGTGAGGYLGNGYTTTNGSSTTTVTSTTPQITSQTNYPYGYNVYGEAQTSAIGNSLVTTYPGYNVSGSTTVTTTELTTPATTTATTSGAFAGYVNLFLIGTGTGSIESEVTSTDFMKVDHGIGYGASIAAGAYWNRLIGAMPTGLRSEVEVAYHQGPVSNVNLTSSGDAAEPGENTNILTGMLNTAFDIGSGSLKPYVGVGGGVAKISATHSGAGVPFATIESTVPAIQAFAGVKFNLTNNLALNAGGKYVHTFKSTSVGTFGSDTEHDIGLYAGQVGVTFSF